MGMEERIMVVDDNRGNLRALEKLLHGYAIAIAESGEEALKTASAFQPDVVILDAIMPGVDGYETCLRLRRMPEFRTPPRVIMLSARNVPEESARAYQAGADDFLTKPFDPEDLRSRVAAQLRLRSLAPLEASRDELMTSLARDGRAALNTLSSAVVVLRRSMAPGTSRAEAIEAIEYSVEELDSLFEQVELLFDSAGGQREIAAMSAPVTGSAALRKSAAPKVAVTAESEQAQETCAAR